jgi:hypothetical protein
MASFAISHALLPFILHPPKSSKTAQRISGRLRRVTCRVKNYKEVVQVQ